jgi:hypothetical protein
MVMKSKPKKGPKYTLIMTAKDEYTREHGLRQFSFYGNNLEKILLAIDSRKSIHKKTCFRYAHIIRNTQWEPKFKETQTLLFIEL